MENRIISRTSIALLMTSIVVTMLLWMFAFWDMPESSPEWLTRAQAVCFGKTETGLPDSSGWIVLILSPLLLMSSLYITYADDLALSVRDLFKSQSGKILILILSVAVISEGAWVSTRIKKGLDARFDPSTVAGTMPLNYPKISTYAPDFKLVNQLGSNVSISDFKGRPIILSFIFAHCQSVCPVLVHSIKAGRKLTMDEQTAVLLITLDPLRDTPASLPTLSRKWELGDQEYVLSGQPSEVEDVIKNYNIPTSRDEKNGDIVHPALVYVIDRSGNLAYSFNNPSPEWIMEAVKRL